MAIEKAHSAIGSPPARAGVVYRNPTYYLGTRVNGAVYRYTALGEFRSAGKAVDRCVEHRAIVFEQWDVYKVGGKHPFGLSESVAVASCIGRGPDRSS